MEKLSSGYRINRVADDAASLCISEKMRHQIRGLNQGRENAQDGISMLQVGDGALDEQLDILQRMNELSIKAANGTNSELDRKSIDEEFQMLKTELTRISKTTTFNEERVFEDHKNPRAELLGNVEWNDMQRHIITEGKNDLRFTYTSSDGKVHQSPAIKVPEGTYTTKELVDELDIQLYKLGLWDEGVSVNYEGGKISLSIEGGVDIGNIEGNMQYLFFDTFSGGGLGALLGTTVFVDGYPLEINSENNNLQFSIMSINGGKDKEIDITIPDGEYSKKQIIDFLNKELENHGTNVRASEYGSGIQLGSDDCIVTKFRGNMFKIDDPSSDPKSSVFFDNIKYGNMNPEPAKLEGGYVLTNNPRDTVNQKFKIDSTNNTLTFTNTNNIPGSSTITIPEGEYDINEITSKLQSLIDADAYLNDKLTVESKGPYSNYYGINLVSKANGPTSKIGLDSTSSAYATLFTDRKYATFGSASISTIPRSYEYNETASITGSKQLGSSVNITAGTNEKFTVKTNNGDYEITIPAGNYTQAQLKSKLDDVFNNTAGCNDLVASIVDKKLRISNTKGSNISSVSVAASGSNSGYKDLFEGRDVATRSRMGSLT